MAILKSEVVPKNSGAVFGVKNGQRLRIAGKSIVDFVAFNLHDLPERFDQARTNSRYMDGGSYSNVFTRPSERWQDPWPPAGTSRRAGDKLSSS